MTVFGAGGREALCPAELMDFQHFCYRLFLLLPLLLLSPSSTLHFWDLCGIQFLFGLTAIVVEKQYQTTKVTWGN